MFTDLFSSLDGAQSFTLWFPSMSILLFLLTSYNLHTAISPVMNSISNLWSTAANSRFNAFKIILVSLFTLMLWNNFSGLTPFTYTLTSDLLPMFSIGLLMWFFLLLSGYFFSFTRALSHLAPSGAPFMLLPFLVIIETISLVIRPLTLTVRLIANISAGHIVLGLIANTLSVYFMTSHMLSLLLISVGYMLFEFFVAIIQAYIFTLLVSLYQAEHP